MFSREHWQIKLAYAGLGALLLFIGMMLSPVTAQRDKFREIECTALRVVDPATGEVRSVVATNKDGGVIEVYGNDGKHKVRLGVLVDAGGSTCRGRMGILGCLSWFLLI